MPFNGLNAIPRIFGELSVEGAFYPIALGMVVAGASLLLNTSLAKPQHISFKLLVLFLVWVFISGIVNCLTIVDASTKGRTGVEKLILQSILLVFVFLTALLGYHVAVRVWKDRTLKIIRRAVLFSFIIAGIYSLIEIPYLLGASWAEEVLVGISSLFRSESVLYPGKLRSICGEASWFGSYFSFIYPWLLSYLFYSKRRFLLYLGIVVYALVMVYFTFSRTAYFITALETLLFILLMAKRNKSHKEKMRFFVFLFVLAGLGSTVFFAPATEKPSLVVKSFFIKDTAYRFSNIGRLGSSFAGLKMGCANPIAGVGLGQYGFHMSKHTPSWAWASDEIHHWASTSSDTSWAPVHNIHVRIFAELGVVGLTLWLLIWGTAWRSIYKITRKLRHYSQKEEMFGSILLVTIFGVMLSGFNSDSFRFMGYWFLLPVVWAWVRMNSMQLNKDERRGQKNPKKHSHFSS